MDTRSGRVFVAVLALLVAGGVVMPVALADSHEYRISVEGSVPIPEQTKQIDEEGVEGEFTFNSVKAVDPGERITVQVDGIPDGDFPKLILKKLVDGDTLESRGIIEYPDPEGEATFRIPADLAPGLYFLSVETSTIESLYPIIVQEYNVDVDWETIPGSAESGSEILVSAEVTRAVNPEDLQRIQYVDVVIANEKTLHNETLPLTEETNTSVRVSGSVTINEDTLPPGDDYSIYVAGRGPETLEGLRVPVGISEQRALEVTGPSTPTSTTTSDPLCTTVSTPSPTTASPTTTCATAPSPTTTTSSTATPPTGTEAPGSTTTAPESSTETNEIETNEIGTFPMLPNGTHDPGNELTPTRTEGGILTPGGTQMESSGRQTATGGQPGFAVTGAVLAVSLAVALFRRR